MLTSSLSAQSAPADLTLLNYALTLENLEAASYTQGLTQFSSADLGNSTFIQGFGSVIGGDVYAYLCLIRDHETQHVRTLQSLITGLGRTPAKPCTYSFGYKTADDFINLAAMIENTGVMAYDGALSQISSASVKTTAAPSLQWKGGTRLTSISLPECLPSPLHSTRPQPRLPFWPRLPGTSRRAKRTMT